MLRFLVFAAMSLCLILSASAAFGQCGADGKQPCGITKIVPKKNTIKPKPKSVQTKKTIVGTKTGLKIQLLGRWELKEGDDATYGWVFNGNGKGMWLKNEYFCEFRYDVSGSNLFILPMECEYIYEGANEYKFKISDNVLEITDVSIKDQPVSKSYNKYK